MATTFKIETGIAVVLFAIGIALVIFWARGKRSFFEGFADAPAYKFVMYGVDWCPHCVKAKPEFEALGATKTIGGKVVAMSAVNPEKDPKAVEGLDIQGYPTFHLYDGAGKLVQEYQGERKTADFQSFLNSI
jgi:thiol-disulfide isomerase/thioredoxin